MPLEVEVKLKVDSHDPIRAQLIEAGAEFLGRVLETNHIFDSPERTLWASDQGLRVRSCHSLEGHAPPATLTYKGPRLESQLKHRQEIQIAVDDAEAARAMLEELCFMELMCFEKQRETWQLNGCLIELDELPYLGCYVEIEGPDEQQVRHTQEMIALTDGTQIPRTYIGLLRQHCEEHSLSWSIITFDRVAK